MPSSNHTKTAIEVMLEPLTSEELQEVLQMCDRKDGTVESHLCAVLVIMLRAHCRKTVLDRALA